MSDSTRGQLWGSARDDVSASELEEKNAPRYGKMTKDFMTFRGFFVHLTTGAVPEPARFFGSYWRIIPKDPQKPKSSKKTNLDCYDVSVNI